MKSKFKSILVESFVPFLVMLLLVVVFLYKMDDFIEEYSQRPYEINLDTQADGILAKSLIRHQLSVKDMPVSDQENAVSINQLVFQRNYTEALAGLNKLLPLARKNQDVQLLTAYCYLKVGKPAKSLLILNKLKKSNSSAKLDFYFGLVYGADPANFSLAVNHYRAYLKKEGRSYEGLVNLGLLYYGKKEYEKAASSFSSAAEVSSGRRRSLAVYRIGLSLLAQNKNSNAEKMFRKAVRIYPLNLRARKKLASVVYKKSPQEGAEEFLRITKLDSRYTFGYYKVAKYYHDKGDDVKAVKILKKGIPDAQNPRTLKSFLGSIYLSRGEYENSQDVYGELAVAYPGHKRYVFNLARSFYGQKKYAEAAAGYRKALRIDPGYYKAILNLGVTFARMEKYDKALVYYLKASEIKPGSSKIYYNLGLMYQRMHRDEKSLENYKKAIALKADYPEAYFNLGIIQKRKGNANRAIRFYKKAILQNSRYVLPYVNLALIYREKKLSLKAEKILLRGVAATGNLKLKNMLARLFYEEKKIEKALSLYREIIVADVSNTGAMIGIARIHIDRGNYNKSIRYLKKYFFYRPTDPRGRYLHMLALYNTKKYRKALQEIEIIDNLEKGYQDIYSYREKIKIELKR